MTLVVILTPNYRIEFRNYWQQDLRKNEECEDAEKWTQKTKSQEGRLAVEKTKSKKFLSGANSLNLQGIPPWYS